jgi:phosphoribosyl-AMP cyclohydrolase
MSELPIGGLGLSPPDPQRSASDVDDAVARLKFDAAGLLPAVVQDEKDGAVLMVAWMDAEAVRRTLTTGHTWFWSRSRRRHWQKGETSGNVQHVRSVTADCDLDTLLVRVEQVGVACHEGTRSCFSHPLGGGA